MPKLRLTDVTVRALEPPSKGQVTYWDEVLKSFGCRVSQGGSKSFVVMHGTDRQRVTIGRYPVISLSDARAEARRILAEHTLGKFRPQSITFQDAVVEFLTECAQRNKERTVSDYHRLLNRHFRFGRVQLTNISQQEVMGRIRSLANTPSEQTHAFVVARAFFKWAVRNRMIERSPLEGQRLPAPRSSREHVLSDHELAHVYQVSLKQPYPYGAIVALLVLTGQRRGEIAALEWEWIDRDAQTITLPASITKNRRSHTFPYGAAVTAIIDGLPEINEYLFPASRSHVRGKSTTVFNGWPKAKVAFDRELEDVAPYRLHDLRRTFSSTLAALGTPIHVTEKLLNHVTGSLGGVAAIYNRYSYMDEMREAIERYEDHLAKLIKA